ncbi:MAG: nucleotide-binding protein [Acidobacteria bacterium]|nr:nucleotide-binding protein [Acidobacteriota bacterium]
MTTVAELAALAAECDRIAQLSKQKPLSAAIEALDEAIARIGESSSGSWIGYQSRVYYRGFRRPVAGDYFSQEWGFDGVFSYEVSGNWAEVDYDDVYGAIMQVAGHPDIKALEDAASKALEAFERNRDELLNILTHLLDQTRRSTFEELRAAVSKTKCFNEAEIIDGIAPTSFGTRDATAAEQGLIPPHHVRVFAWLAAQRLPFQNLAMLGKIAGRAASYLKRIETTAGKTRTTDQCVFIGHGRDPQWKDVAEFVGTRLKLHVEEFNRQPAAGLTTTERLQEMLQKATFALLIMTAEDEHTDETIHARENVIHEIGLFQQKLGWRRAIILLEQGCREFSNISGVVQIRFPKSFIKAAYEEIRQVLEREGVIAAG